MPFDFTNCKKYVIDYEKLYNELNSKRILDNKDVQEIYLKRWIQVLYKLDMILNEELNTKEKYNMLLIDMLNEPDTFQQELFYGKVKLLLNFRITQTLIVIKDVDLDSISKIDIENFTGENKRIFWNKINENVDSYKNANKPIVIIPFEIGEFNYLVIDGNHRVTYKVNNGYEQIEGVIISKETILEYHLLSSGFDEKLYIMHNELMYMVENTQKGKDAISLIKKSFLTNGKVII